MRILMLIPVFLLLTVSCYEEVMVEPDPDLFDLTVSPDTKQFIYNSRDTSYTVEDPLIILSLNDQPLALREIRVRGKSATRFQRKSYVVFLSDPIAVQGKRGTGLKLLSRFKLIALAMDYTYIENRVAFGLLEEAGVMPLFYKFVEFKINGQTQGVYLLIEDPEAYYKEIGSEYILRRGYQNSIDDDDYTPSNQFIPYETYKERFLEIYTSLTTHQGEELKRELSLRMDLDSYFRKIAIDYLLQNGDYTDEVYLYSQVETGTIRFYPIPWDYDDIFSFSPHELARSWGMGSLFGKRYYESLEDIYADVGTKLIFSIEDDLDYSIAKDTVLYSSYIRVISELFEELKQADIERIFAETKAELTPFYDSEEVIEQSQFDQYVTTKELWITNMDEKKALLISRLEEIQQQLKASQ